MAQTGGKQQGATTSGPIQDFARIVRVFFRVVRYASLVIIGVTAVVMTREVVSAFSFLHGIHPVLGWAFLLVFAAAFAYFVVRPVMRYWRMPPVVKPPSAPARRKAGTADALRRIDFLARYLRCLLENPRLADRLADVEAAISRAAEVRAGLSDADATVALASLDAFERDQVEPLLRPLDQEANKVIRQEALAVGIGTAVSMNGTVDAFIVLWRNANLVARVATIYFGRPGVRGSLFILRDVATAMFVATQMQGIMETVGGLFGGWFGRAGSVLVGPVGDGAVNALATMRIGYVAKARCRSYRPWTDATIPEILKQTMKEVASQGRGVVKDVVTAVVKGGLIKLPAEIARKTGEFLSGMFSREEPELKPQR